MLWLIGALLLGQAATPSDAVQKKALQATVRVYNAAKEQGGTAAAIGREGAVVYLLTAAHVVHGAEQVELQVFAPDAARPKHRFANVAVIATTSALGQDLALLRVVDADRAIAAVLPLRKKAAPMLKLPASACSAGCSTDGAPAVQSERVLQAPLVRKPGADEAVRCFKCKTPAVAGRSGGPLVDGDGNLLGIASGGDSAASYFIHPDEIRPFLKRNGLGFLAE